MSKAIDILRRDTTGGILLVIAALIALIWANSPLADSYFSLRDAEIGPGWFDGLFRLSVGAWAADGLLAVFFFIVGLELKHEIVAGELSDPKKVALPVAAAAGGVAVPAIIFTLINWGNSEALRGWAIPTATDIAFAVAVLAIVGSNLPQAARLFLLTLAVVDDLIAIAIIAIFYSHGGRIIFLAAVAVPVVIFAVLVQKFPKFFATHYLATWLILLPLGIVAWGFMFASGIHATIAGVILGFCAPAAWVDTDRDGFSDEPIPGTDPSGKRSLAHELNERLGIISSTVAVPIFAFFAAGVNVGGAQGLASAFADTVTLGIIVGLVVGKLVGIAGTTYLMTAVSKGRMHPGIPWIDLVGVALLGAIGFTVSLLIGELSFGIGSLANDHAKVGVLAASLIAAVAASGVLIPRNRHYSREETVPYSPSDRFRPRRGE
ncbi:MAG: Na+/H+ antiporter NhaA [Corynebacterium sp.]|nr:Na+/H+ antiporter NhaA [Corynebacterium sp.]